MDRPWGMIVAASSWSSRAVALVRPDQGYWLTLLIDILKFVVLTVAWVHLLGAHRLHVAGDRRPSTDSGFYIAAVFSGPIPFAVIDHRWPALSAFVVALVCRGPHPAAQGRLLRHLHLRPGAAGPERRSARSSGS